MSRFRRMACIALTLAALSLAGCATVGPDYVRPSLPVPDTWNTGSASVSPSASADTKILSQWWSTLGDPLLTSLIERAVQRNPDLREASARVREARARRGISEAALFPVVDMSGNVVKSSGSEETGGGAERDLYSAGFDARWEIDLFGGRRRDVEASQADLEASTEDLRDVLVTLIGEVALNYVDVRSFQARLAIAVANRTAQSDAYDITRWRFEAGLTSRLDVDQARYNLENTQAQIPPLRSGLERATNRLDVLLGLHPGSLKEELSGQEPIPVPPQEMLVGVPADILRNRPDVRRAERRLAAQTARIGVATAELYPKLTLTGSIGLEALSFGKLFSSGSRTYGFGPAFTWNIFDAGSIRKNIEAQNALQEQALIQYESAILGALEEVNNGLVTYAQEQLRLQSLTEASRAAASAVEIAQLQYASGVIDFQVVLDAQRSLLSFQDQRAVSEAAVTADLISLYKALGGGWTSLAPEATEAGATQ